MNLSVRRGMDVGVGGGGGCESLKNSVPCESSDAAPGRLSTWLGVLIQLSLQDHHYIDTIQQHWDSYLLAGWLAGWLTD